MSNDDAHIVADSPCVVYLTGIEQTGRGEPARSAEVKCDCVMRGRHSQVDGIISRSPLFDELQLFLFNYSTVHLIREPSTGRAKRVTVSKDVALVRVAI